MQPLRLGGRAGCILQNHHGSLRARNNFNPVVFTAMDINLRFKIKVIQHSLCILISTMLFIACQKLNCVA
jgi:hypothetical protein